VHIHNQKAMNIPLVSRAEAYVRFFLDKSTKSTDQQIVLYQALKAWYERIHGHGTLSNFGSLYVEVK
jgi:hypothetical protein